MFTEATHISMKKVWYIHDEIVYSKENNCSKTMCNSRSESHKHSWAKKKKKKAIQKRGHYIIYIMYENKQN